jgi:hypothetical protein
MRKIKRKILFVMMLFVCSIGFSNSVYGLEEELKQSLFLPTNHWLFQKAAEIVRDKTYYLSRMKADTDHIIVLKYGKDKKTYTDSSNRVVLHVLLKPVNARSYVDCEEKQGGYISLFVYFTNPQREELLVDEFSSITESTSTYGFNQNIIDQQIDTALENPENADYGWINGGGAKRELVVPGCNGLGYVISKDTEQPVFFSLYHCVNLGISQHTFTPWEKVQERIDHWHRQQNARATVGSGPFDFSKIKFGTKS